MHIIQPSRVVWRPGRSQVIHKGIFPIAHIHPIICFQLRHFTCNTLLWRAQTIEQKWHHWNHVRAIRDWAFESGKMSLARQHRSVCSGVRTEGFFHCDSGFHHLEGNSSFSCQGLCVLRQAAVATEEYQSQAQEGKKKTRVEEYFFSFSFCISRINLRCRKWSWTEPAEDFCFFE